MLIKKNDILADKLLAMHQLIPVAFRLGIEPCIENKTVEQACSMLGLHSDFVTSVLNCTICTDFTPTDNPHKFSIMLCSDYILKSHIDYHTQLTNIERHIKLLSNESNTLSIKLIHGLFKEYQEELSSLIKKEEESLIPYINKVYEIYFSTYYKPQQQDFEEKLVFFSNEYSTVNDKLNDLKNILVKHAKGKFDKNILYGVLFALDRLQHDIQATERIEKKLLLPVISEMEIEINSRTNYSSDYDKQH